MNILTDISQAKKKTTKAIFALRVKTVAFPVIMPRSVFSFSISYIKRCVTVSKCLRCEGALEPQRRYRLRGAEGDLVNYQAAASASSPED